MLTLTEAIGIIGTTDLNARQKSNLSIDRKESHAPTGYKT
jgi:hypothetical protein